VLKFRASYILFFIQKNEPNLGSGLAHAIVGLN